jgi:hypothetical protein
VACRRPWRTRQGCGDAPAMARQKGAELRGRTAPGTFHGPARPLGGPGRAAGRAGHSGGVRDGDGNRPWREMAVRPPQAIGGAANGLSKSTRTRRSCAREELGGGALTTMNFVGEESSAGGAADGREEDDCLRPAVVVMDGVVRLSGQAKMRIGCGQEELGGVRRARPIAHLHRRRGCTRHRRGRGKRARQLAR